MQSSQLTEASYLINESHENDEVIDVENIEPNFFIRISDQGEIMPQDVFNHLSSFLPYYSDLLNLSQTSKVMNKKVSKTDSGRLAARLIELQPACPSACFSYFSKPNGINHAFPYLISFSTAALGSIAGAALGYYVADGALLNWTRPILGSFIGSAIGSFIGNFPGAFSSMRHGICEGVGPTVLSILGSGLGGGLLLTSLHHGDGGEFLIIGLSGIAGGIVGGIPSGCLGAKFGIFAVNKNGKYLSNLIEKQAEIHNTLQEPYSLTHRNSI